MHKITLTGNPSGEIRQIDDIYIIDMATTGTPTAPKGLPVAGEITYSILFNEKQKNAFEKSLKEHRVRCENAFLVVQGEPSMDVSSKYCSGDLVVIAFKLELLPEKSIKEVAPPKQKKQKKKKEPVLPSKPTKEVPNFKKDNVKPVVAQKPVDIVKFLSNGMGDISLPLEEEYIYPTEAQLIPIEDIKIPDSFLQTPPNKFKTKEKLMKIVQEKMIDEAIVVNADFVLVDGYRRYVILQTLKHKKVPIIVKK